jgi:hypothetical protein
MILLKCIIQKNDDRVFYGVFRVRIERSGRLCEHCNGILGFTKYKEFLDQLWMYLMDSGISSTSETVRDTSVW